MDSGFTLIEVMIALGLVSVLFLAFGEMNLNSYRSKKSSDFSNEFTEMMGLVGQTLLKNPTCSQALTGLNLAAFPVSLDYVGTRGSGAAAAGTTLLQRNKVLQSGLVVNQIQMDLIAPSIATSAGSVENMVQLHIEATKTTQGSGQKIMGSSKLSKDFIFAVWVNAAGTVSSCASPSEAGLASPGAPPTVYATPVPCPGVAPACPDGSNATCCKAKNDQQTPFYYCQELVGDWSCN
jgi:prepilin-type N-terminal cleavage/methylation domain-containing protein